MKYAFIQRNKRVWPICVQCRVLLRERLWLP